MTALTAVALVWLASASATTALSPVGLWQTIDERTGAARALVRIEIVDGRLVGTIERVLPRGDESPDPICTRCRGERRGRKVVGLDIVRGHRLQGERWVDGVVLDPENGKEYRSALWIEADGSLRLRGYVGIFHRTQRWQRAPAPQTGAAASRP